MKSLALRDHAKQILQAIAKDLTTFQTEFAQAEKSKGRAVALSGAPDTAAETHAILRAQSAFDINQLASEYRALRASVLWLWTDAYQPDPTGFEDLIRFNEAIDQALAESISFFHSKVEESRNLLLGMLGHDLRSPLQTIQMTASYLAALNAGATVSDAANRLVRSGTRMRALLDDLLDFNRTSFGLGAAASSPLVLIWRTQPSAVGCGFNGSAQHMPGLGNATASAYQIGTNRNQRCFWSLTRTSRA